MYEVRVATITLGGVLIAGYVNNILAEEFRRWRERQSLSAAFAGELGSTLESVGKLRESLVGMAGMVEEGEPLFLPEFPMPTSPIFEANAGRIGLLKATHAGEIASLYERIRTFRVLYLLLSQHLSNPEKPPSWNARMIEQCDSLVAESEGRAKKLVIELNRYAENNKPAKLMQLFVGVATLFLFVAVICWVLQG